VSQACCPVVGQFFSHPVRGASELARRRRAKWLWIRASRPRGARILVVARINRRRAPRSSRFGRLLVLSPCGGSTPATIGNCTNRSRSTGRPWPGAGAPSGMVESSTVIRAPALWASSLRMSTRALIRSPQRSWPSWRLTCPRVPWLWSYPSSRCASTLSGPGTTCRIRPLMRDGLNCPDFHGERVSADRRPARQLAVDRRTGDRLRWADRDLARTAGTGAPPQHRDVLGASDARARLSHPAPEA
jgi:hypothetical protein